MKSRWRRVVWERFRKSWRRLLLWWLLASSWFLIFAPAIGIVWYAVGTPSAFDHVISALKGGSLSSPNTVAAAVETTVRYGQLRSALRIGGHEEYHEGSSLRAITIGLNADLPASYSRQYKVSSGEYRGTYEATYLARFAGSRAVRSMVIVRNVPHDGSETIEVHVLSLNWLIQLALQCLVGGALAAVFLEAYRTYRNRARAETTSPSVLAGGA